MSGGRFSFFSQDSGNVYENIFCSFDPGKLNELDSLLAEIAAKKTLDIRDFDLACFVPHIEDHVLFRGDFGHDYFGRNFVINHIYHNSFDLLIDGLKSFLANGPVSFSRLLSLKFSGRDEVLGFYIKGMSREQLDRLVRYCDCLSKKVQDVEFCCLDAGTLSIDSSSFNVSRVLFSVESHSHIGLLINALEVLVTDFDIDGFAQFLNATFGEPLITVSLL